MTGGDRPNKNIGDSQIDLYFDRDQMVRVSFACYAIDKFFPTASVKEKLGKFELLFPYLKDDRAKLKSWAEWGNLIPRSY